MNRDNLGTGLVCFLLGAAAGAAVALLYAPREGEATRRLIGEKATEVRGRAGDLTSNISQTAKERLSSASDRVHELISRGQHAANNAIDTAAEKAKAGVNGVG